MVRETSKGVGEVRGPNVQLDAQADHHGDVPTAGTTLVDHDVMASFSRSHGHDHHHDHDHHSSNRTNNSLNHDHHSELKKQKTAEPSSADGKHDNDRVVVVEEVEEEAGKRRVERLSTPDRGRIMVARSGIPKGTFLYRISAQAIVCDSENRTRRCASCLKRLSTGLFEEKDAEKGVPTISSLPDNNGSNTQDVPKDELAWMYTVGNTFREAITLFSQLFDPYTQDYCRLLIRILTHRFHELMDRSASQHGNRADDPPYLTPTDLAQEPGPLPYSVVEDLVANQESFSREKIEGDFENVAQVLDAFRAHLEIYYSPLHYTRHRHEALRRLSLKQLRDLIMREECNSFGLYEYPPLPSPNTTTTTFPVERNNNNNNNGKTGYALGLFLRHHLYGINHSCSPNLLHVAHNNHLLFYAGRDILPGEEINIGYLEFGPHYRLPARKAVGTSTTEAEVEKAERRKEAFETRKRFLKDNFYFDCGCTRCTYESAYYSCDNNSSDIATRATATRLMEGLSEEILRARQDSHERNDDNDDRRWGCVACGHRQSS
ncbi:MAG: hypothetical protein J3R72DRAFT_415883 [Linnemannia gamsii]|nr:MAG: hypothetical protein J3R72DRAFT_415883 [Linnemannia gamsii]